jgi:hypothetical protein
MSKSLGYGVVIIMRMFTSTLQISGTDQIKSTATSVASKVAA